MVNTFTAKTDYRYELYFVRNSCNFPCPKSILNTLDKCLPSGKYVLHFVPKDSRTTSSGNFFRVYIDFEKVFKNRVALSNYYNCSVPNVITFLKRVC